MSDRFKTSDLEAYLDEALPVAEASEIEDAARADEALARRLVMIHSRRDAGIHSLGEIWRRHRLSCPSREELGSFLLGTLVDEHADYITFHIESTGCRYCQANLDDLREIQSQADDKIEKRRRRYFQSSAGLLRKE